MYMLMRLKTAGQVANSVDLIRRRVLRRLIWDYTVCSGLPVTILQENMVYRFFFIIILFEVSFHVTLTFVYPSF